MAVIFRYIWGPVRELATSRTTRSREGMTAMEALRVQNDALRVEMQRLEVENARFHDEHPDESGRIDLYVSVHNAREELLLGRFYVTSAKSYSWDDFT